MLPLQVHATSSSVLDSPEIDLAMLDSLGNIGK
jgi:hypothetical protein